MLSALSRRIERKEKRNPSNMDTITRILHYLKDLFRGNLLGGLRSSDWYWFKKMYEGICPKECRCCGTKRKVELHHIVPFHEDPSLELDVNNVIWLCRTCHHLLGHLKFWKSHNVNVEEDAKVLRNKIENRP